MPGDDPRPVLLSAVTILDRATLRQLDAESLARLWHDIHAGTRARLTTSVARFYLDHHDVTIHDEPASCALAWDGDDNAVGYVLSAMAYKHVDLSHALADVEDHREGEWIRLHTKCGCESRSMRYPAPLPLTIHKSVAGGGVRTFRKGAVNTFGATTYHEVT
jgi:hypothetical protein